MKKLIFFILFGIFFNSVIAEAKTFKVSLAQLSVAAESNEKGVLVELVKLMAKSTGNTVIINVYPFKRSILNIKDRDADFHIPLIKNPNINEDKSEFDYSTNPIFEVNFVLYTNKDKKIDKKNLRNHLITTDAAHTDLFGFPIEADYKMETSFTKLSLGRTDGYIFADVVADTILKKLDLKNIRRELYQVFQVHAVLPKGEKGKDADKMITEGIRKLKESGEYDKLMKPIFHEYDDWQP